jgi:hypothetical protein
MDTVEKLLSVKNNEEQIAEKIAELEAELVKVQVEEARVQGEKNLLLAQPKSEGDFAPKFARLRALQQDEHVDSSNWWTTSSRSSPVTPCKAARRARSRRRRRSRIFVSRGRSQSTKRITQATSASCPSA